MIADETRNVRRSSCRKKGSWLRKSSTAWGTIANEPSVLPSVASFSYAPVLGLRPGSDSASFGNSLVNVWSEGWVSRGLRSRTCQLSRSPGITMIGSRRIASSHPENRNRVSRRYW